MIGRRHQFVKSFFILDQRHAAPVGENGDGAALEFRRSQVRIVVGQRKTHSRIVFVFFEQLDKRRQAVIVSLDAGLDRHVAVALALDVAGLAAHDGRFGVDVLVGDRGISALGRISSM